MYMVTRRVVSVSTYTVTMYLDIGAPYVHGNLARSLKSRRTRLSRSLFCSSFHQVLKPGKLFHIKELQTFSHVDWKFELNLIMAVSSSFEPGKLFQPWKS